jgi:hypothetical protein
MAPTAQLEPDNRHLQTLSVDPARPFQVLRILRSLVDQGVAHELGLFEQTHLRDIDHEPRKNLLLAAESG